MFLQVLVMKNPPIQKMESAKQPDPDLDAIELPARITAPSLLGGRGFSPDVKRSMRCATFGAVFAPLFFGESQKNPALPVLCSLLVFYSLHVASRSQ